MSQAETQSAKKGLTKYETIVIFDHLAGEAAVKNETKKIQTLISSHGGISVTIDSWGRKEMPGTGSRMADGFYVAFNFESPLSTTISEVESILRISDAVKKFQTHKQVTKVRKFKGNPKAKSTMGSFDDYGDISDNDF